jgi:hypothetical protein
MLTTTLVLQGPSGAGKSDKVCTLGTYDSHIGWLDADGKALDTIKSYIARTGKKVKAKVKYPNLSKDKQPIEAGSPRAWHRSLEIVKEFCSDPQVGWVALDSMNFLQEIDKDCLVASGGINNSGRKAMAQALWDFLRADFLKLIIEVKASGKGLVMICHDKIAVDETTGRKVVVPDLQAGLKNLIPQQTSEYWHCFTKIDPQTRKAKYMVRTKPDAYGDWKTNLQIPDEWEFNVPEFEKALEEYQKIDISGVEVG